MESMAINSNSELDVDLEYKVITSVKDLHPYKTRWNAINDLLPHENPLMSFEWVVSFLESKEYSNKKWAVAVCEKKSELLAILPFIITNTKKFGLPIQQLELPYDNQTMSVDILIKLGFEDVVFKPLIEYTFFHFNKAQQVILRRVDKNSNLKSYYENKWLSYCEFCENGASIKVPSNFDDFRSKLAKNFKSNLNKARNKAEKSGGIQYLDGDFDDLSAIDKLDIVCRLEDSGWKGETGTSIIKSKEDYDFYHNLIKRLSDRGKLHFHFLKVDKSIVAGNLGVKQSGKILLWKLAYDDNYKKYSPGGLLLEELIRKESDEESSNIIDLMTNESWYNNWNMDWRPFQNIYLFRKGILGLYLQSVFKLKGVVKSLIKN